MARIDQRFLPPQALRLEVEAVQTADFTAVNGKVYPISPATATLNIQLPAPSASFHCILKDLSGDLAGKVINIVRNSTEKIDGQLANITLNSEYQSSTLISDGVDWYLI